MGRPSIPPIPLIRCVERLPRLAGTTMPRAEAELRLRRHDERRVHRHRLAVHQNFERRSRHGDHTLVFEVELRTEKRHFKRRGIRIVPHQDVRETMRHRIHRAGDRHAARLQPPSAPILDGREHAGLDDACRTHVRRSYSTRSIA